MTTICVIGLGYIGLPTACLFANAGFVVHGVDIDQRKVELVNNGQAPFVEPGLQDLLLNALAKKTLQAFTAAREADVFILALPTPVVDGIVDLTTLRVGVQQVGRILKPGNCLIIESTIPPGTINGIVQQELKATSTFHIGDFCVAYCPERAMPGKTIEEIVNGDRIIGAVDENSAKTASALYRHITKGDLLITDPITAEVAKLAENTYRDINIAFANELAGMCDDLGANVWKVISIANKHPRVKIHSPGPGVGGYCLPKDPWILANSTKAPSSLTRNGRGINSFQSDLVKDETLRLLQRYAKPPYKVAILGAAYKGDVDDIRESPTITIATQLKRAGVDVSISDPFVKIFPYPISAYPDAIKQADMILLLTDHSEFKSLSPAIAASVMKSKLVFDTRNVLDVAEWSRMNFYVRVLGVSKNGQMSTSQNEF